MQGVLVDNAAALQQQVSKGSNQFLSTLAKDGMAQFLTVLKPCGILLPHTHQRANELYSIIFGVSTSPTWHSQLFARMCSAPLSARTVSCSWLLALSHVTRKPLC